MDNEEKRTTRRRKPRTRSPRKRKNRSKRAKSEAAKRNQTKSKSSRKPNSRELSEIYAQRGRERRRKQVEDDLKRFQEEIDKKLEEGEATEPKKSSPRRVPGQPYQVKSSVNAHDRRELWKLGASSVKAPKGFIKNTYMRPEYSSSIKHPHAKKSASKASGIRSQDHRHQTSSVPTSPRSV
eukprot:gb/GECG01009603.1/.p1 GENE.gb/GECG01009603.1/~~gb/GECG01009603.1/.p1  ORF type:complete len:181 (+),score=21.32 gb/GECG01009603.1/:1-543(+)